VYNGRSVIEHQILPARIGYPWLLRRLFYCGVNRYLVGGAPGSTHFMGLWDCLFAPLVVPVYLAGYGLARAAAVGRHWRRTVRRLIDD
jgi:hypothetical protein